MDHNKLSIGLAYEYEVKTSQKDSAISMGSGSVEVFATPSMIAYMERSAMLLVENQLEKQQTTVGSFLKINHLKATAIGQTIRFHAKLVKIEGEKLEFEVSAYHQEEEIGNGVHTRYIINKEKFLSNLSKT